MAAWSDETAIPSDFLQLSNLSILSFICLSRLPLVSTGGIRFLSRHTFHYRGMRQKHADGIVSVLSLSRATLVQISSLLS